MILKKENIDLEFDANFDFITALTLLVHPQPEAADYHCAANDGLGRSLVAEDDIREHHVEYCRQGSPDVVERDADVLQAEVVEGDHADEHDGERQDLLQDRGRHCDLAAGHRLAELGRQRGDPIAHGGRDYTLIPCDEKRSLHTRLATQECFVDKNQSYRHDPETEPDLDLPVAKL